jgi:UDP-2,3-diacylglucosamine hydrolase
MTTPAPPAVESDQGRTLGIQGERPALFISDLHLDLARPHTVRLFQAFMDQVAPGAGSLFILGDFFEAWVGDDDLDAPFNAGIVAALAGLAGAGTAVHYLHGNRDFLVGPGFARAAGLQMLPDPVRVDLFGTPTLLSHGDLFCTDDAAYQAFRAQVRQAEWQRGFLARPRAERHALARALREGSEQAKAEKALAIMDVNLETVAEYIAGWGVRRIIHGHTHRPARHLREGRSGNVERWVLPDWDVAGGYLRCDADGCAAVPFPETPPR